MKNRLTTAQIVDQLGVLKAEIAILEEREKFLADRLKKRGKGAYIGNFFDAVVSGSYPERLDVKRLREEKPKLATRYTVRSAEEVLRVNVNARVGARNDAAAA